MREIVVVLVLLLLLLIHVGMVVEFEASTMVCRLYLTNAIVDDLTN